jgi:O-antigen ligase
MIDTLLVACNYLFAVGMPVTHIAGYAAVFAGLCLFWKYLKELRDEPLFLWLLVFVFYATVRSLFSGEPQIGFAATFGYFAHWLLPFILGFCLKENRTVKRLFWVSYGTFVVIAVLAVLAYFGLFTDQLIPGVYFAREGLLKGLRSHIAFGAACIVMSFISLGQGLLRTDLARQKRALFILLSLFFTGAIFLTGSRSYYIAAAVTYPALGIYWAVRTGQWRWLVSGAAGMACIVVLLYFYTPFLRNRIQHTGPQDNNVIERMTLYRVAFWEVRDNPLFGWGPGQGIRQTKYFDQLAARRDVQKHPTLHNFYLNLAADLGLTGLALLIIILYLILGRAWRTARHDPDPFLRAFGFALFWGFLGVLVGDCFDTLLRGPHTAMELFWLTGLLFGQSKERRY